MLFLTFQLRNRNTYIQKHQKAAKPSYGGIEASLKWSKIRNKKKDKRSINIDDWQLDRHISPHNTPSHPQNQGKKLSYPEEPLATNTANLRQYL